MTNVSKLIVFASALALCACNSRELNTDISNTTGWDYFDQKTTNFQAQEGVGNVNPTGMVAIQGGTFTIGEKDEFLTAPRNNFHRTITVSSFYMDKYEITTLNWNEYLHWLEVVFGDVAPQLVDMARPDKTVWREDMAYNDPYVENYFDHPAFSFYPIVGVTWDQAMAYCQWRTDRVNELALIQIGAIAIPDFPSLRPTSDEVYKEAWETKTGYHMDTIEMLNPEDPNDTITMWRPGYDYIRKHFVFNTEKYLEDDEYVPEYGKHSPLNSYGEIRKVNRADGVFVTGYRLPTEAEWEFAAYCPVAGEDGLTIEGKIYPWSGYHPRDMSKANVGMMQANFVRGRGDMMGVSGALNDGYVTTAPVDAYAPNDFGLYNMAGNVNEWVLDVYRETTYQETSEYNSFRGNIYMKPVKDANGRYVLDTVGCIKLTFTSDDDRRNFKDGDRASVIDTDYPLNHEDLEGLENLEKSIQQNDSTSVGGSKNDPKKDPTDVLAPYIARTTRVYKGGSWRDRIYWLNPSTRRFMEQTECSSTVGFRCAMSTLGDQIPSAFTPKK